MALFGGGVLERRYLDEMLPAIAVPERHVDDPGYGYGLGVYIARTRFGPVYRHGGFFRGYNSMLTYFSDISVANAMQVNSDQSAIEQHVDAIVEIVVRRMTPGE